MRAVLIVVVALALAPAALADGPWSAPARVPGSAGTLYDLWFPDSGPGVLTAWCCGGFVPGVPGTRISTSKADDSFALWRTVSRTIATQSVAGSGSERYAFGWMHGQVTEEIVGVVRLTATGVSRPLRVFPPVTVSAALARTPSGTFAMVGQVSARAKDHATRRSIYLVVHRPGHGFTKPVKLAGRGDRADLAVAVTPSGRALAVWARSAEVFVRERFPSGRLGRTRRLISRIGARFPAVALGPNGAAGVTWAQGSWGELALRPAGDVFGPPQRLGYTGGATPEVAAYNDGRFQLAWNENHGEDDAIRVARARDFMLGEAQTIVDAKLGTFRLAVARSGEAAVSWLERGDDGTGPVRAAVQAPGAALFGPPETISATAQCCVGALAIDPATGRTVVAWQAGGPLPNPPVYTASRAPIR